MLLLFTIYLALFGLGVYAIYVLELPSEEQPDGFFSWLVVPPLAGFRFAWAFLHSAPAKDFFNKTIETIKLVWTKFVAWLTKP